MLRCLMFAGILIGLQVLPAAACDPMAGVKAFLKQVHDRHFGDGQVEQFSNRFEPLRQDIFKAIDAGDTESACKKIDEALDMLRDFRPN